MKNNDRSWSGKSRGGSLGYNFFIFIIRNIGIIPAYIFLAFVVIYFIPFAPKATSSIWRYNRDILKYGILKSVVKLYNHYYVFGQTIIDKVAIKNGMAKKYSFEFDNYTELLSLLDNGPVVIIGGHIGCWEIGSEFFGDYASKLNVVMYDGEYKKIKDVLETVNTDYKIIPVNDGGIESLLAIKQAIDEGDYVCFQGDRYIDASNTCKVNFMGKDALFPKGPSMLASKLKTPVVFYFAMRESGRRYRFLFKTLRPGMSQSDILREYTESFEDVVRKYPQQWFNFFNLWQ